MKCSKAQELFSEYMENALEPAGRADFERHLAECAQCNADYRKFHAAVMMVEELQEVEPPAGFHAAVMARVLESKRAKPAWVPWLRVDWRSVFDVNVSVRAAAVGLAAFLLMTLAVRLAPPNAVTAWIFGQPNAATSTVGVNDDENAPAPRPWAPKHLSATHTPAGSDISVGVEVDTRGDQGSVYRLRIATDASEPIGYKVYLLPEKGSSTGVEAIHSGAVSVSRDAVVPVVLSRSCDTGRAVVAKIVWTDRRGRGETYAFLPSDFSPKAAGKSISLEIGKSSVFSMLGEVSAKYGIVVLASGDLGQTKRYLVTQESNPKEALYRLCDGTDLRSRGLASSIYSVEPAE